MKWGVILLEGVISIFLITVLLIPIFKFSGNFINLSTNNINENTFEEEHFIKDRLSLGYNELIKNNTDFSLGSFHNLGSSSDNEINRNFAFFKSKNHIYNREIFYLSTPISNYGECPWKIEPFLLLKLLFPLLSQH